MALVAWLLLLPLGSAAYRLATLGSGASNTTGGGGLVAGMCGECDTYAAGSCALCPNCKWRGGKCMHKCTACCAYKGGCSAAYCACAGKTNVFKGVWKACGPQRKTKSYHFQLSVPSDAADRSKDVFVAIELLRSREDPQLILHFNQEWTARIHREEDTCYWQSENHGHGGGMLLEERSAGHERRGGGSNFSGSLLETARVVCPWSTSTTWEAVPAGHVPDPRTEVIHLRDAEYVRVFKAGVGAGGGMVAVTALEIKAPGAGEPLRIYGGFYVPKFALMYAFDKFWPQYDGSPPKDDGSGIYVSEPIADYKPGRSRFDPPRKPVHDVHVRASKMFEFLDGYLKENGKAVGNKHRHAVGLSVVPGFFAGQVGAMTGAFTGVMLATAVGPVAIPAVMLGFLGGFALPLAGTVWGTKKVTMADTEREVRLLASEKIFEKMRCHRLFQRCGGPAIAPAHGKCPHDGGRVAGGNSETEWESNLLN